MGNWTLKKFGELVEDKTSFLLKKGEEYPNIAMENVLSAKRTPVNVHQKVFTGSGARFKQGDTLFARITPCLQNRKIAYVKDLKGGVGFGSTEFFIFRPKNGYSDGLFIYYLSNLPDLRRLAELSMTGASGRQRANEDAIKEFQVMLPDYPLQQEIGAVLTSYDDLIENNEKRIKALEEMAQLLYTEWFVKFKFPGHEKVRMVDSGTEYGMIPEGWEVKRLGDLAEEIRESVIPKNLDSNSIYVGLEHIPRKTIVLSSWGKVADIKSSKLKFQMEDVLFGKIRPYFHKVVSSPFDGVASSDTIIIRSNDFALQSLILMCVSCENFVAYATSNSQGTKMPRADWKSLSKYQLLIPTDEILRSFSHCVAQTVKYMNTLMFQNVKLEKMRDLLIPQLVTGKRNLKNN